MNLEQLTYIVEVAKVNSLSEAANKLHVSQSAISQSITNLENEFGLKLFKRARTGTHPTKDGIPIIKKIHEAYKLIEEIRLEAANKQNRLRGKLRIATMPAQMIAMVKVIAWLKKEHPELHIEVYEQSSQDTLEAIREGVYDLGMIAMREDLFPYDEMVFDSMSKGKLMVIVAKKSRLAAYPSISPAVLREYPLVLYKDNYIDQFISDFISQFGMVNVLFRTDYDTAIQSALEEGLAVSIGHDYSLRNSAFHVNEQFVMLEIENFVQQPVHFGWIRQKKCQKSLVANYFISRFKLESQLDTH